MGAHRHRALRTPQEDVIVGYHAPPPGLHTGVAVYAEKLRRALEAFCRTNPGAEHADLHLYHIGNNRLHEAIYRQALRKPGVVVLHDAVLHHFMLGTMPEAEYVTEWVYNYGEWRRPVAQELWRNRARASVDPLYFNFPMLRRLMETSLGVVVHNPGAAAMARLAGARRVEIIRHFAETLEQPSAADIGQFRQRLGIEQGARVFGIFGYLREPKRILPCMHAFRRLHAVRPKTKLLIAGEVISGDLERLLVAEGHPAVLRLGHLTDEEFLIAGAAIDCCLNLRYPAAGETSGIAVQMMALGTPVVLTDNAENSEFPVSAVFRVSPGVAESEELFDHMSLATEFPQVARDVGIAGRQHIRRHHSLDSVARRFWEVLCSVASPQS